MAQSIGTNRPNVVIVGAGFGGLYAAQAMKRLPVNITIIDRRNFHLFQPLLYQVASGGLSPGDIAAPIRKEFAGLEHVRVLQGEIVDISPDPKEVIFKDGDRVAYDYLLVATGSRHHYFNHPEWEELAPGLKTVEDALDMRGRILHAFEAAEREPDPVKRQAWLTFVVVGGGPTGVELAGAIGELAHHTLSGEYRTINPADARILLVEHADRILPPFSQQSSERALKLIKKLGVDVRTGTMVEGLSEGQAILKHGETRETVFAKTLLWAAGNKANFLAEVLKNRFGCELDRAGRVCVNEYQELPGHDHVYVIGDMANSKGPDGNPLPGVAPVAMQQGRYFARLLKRRLQGKPAGPFRYFDKGSLAVIGRNYAVAERGGIKLSGFIAWVIWAFVHIAYLIEFESRVIVMLRWAISYFTRKRGARLITGEGLEHPRLAQPEDGKAASIGAGSRS